MSGRAAQVIDEMDDGDEDDLSYSGQPSVVDLPAGVANTERGQPQARRVEENREPAFTVVETDDDGNEIGAQPHREEPLDAELRQEVEYGQGGAVAANGEADHRPRLTRSERSRRQKERFARIDQENRELRERMDQMTQAMGQIEPRLSEIDQARRVSEVRELDRQVQAYQYQAQQARQRVKDAMANQDPDAFEAALDARDAAIRSVETLQAQKRNLEAAPAPRQQPARQEFQAPSRPAPLPPEVLSRVEDFADANPWYKPHDTDDIDSQLILRLDDQVAREGFDPRTDAYWNEIEKRAARYLPHRFGNAQGDTNQRTQQMPRQQQQAPQRRGPMVAGGAQGSSPAPQNNRVMITPARKQALVEIGVVAPDGSVVDRGRYNRMIAGYAAFDRENTAAAR